MTIAKGLANGVPIGVCLARGEAASAMKPGSHGSTFGGNPLACATALTVIKEIRVNNLEDRAAELGDSIMLGLRERLNTLNNVKEIRGKGLMIGIELDAPCGDLVAQAFKQGLLINVTADSVVRLLPHLTTTDEEADQIVEIVAELIKEL